MFAGTGAIVLFPHYRFEHPITGRIITVHGFSYVLAAFLGPFWMAYVGRRVRGVLMAMIVSAVYAAGFVILIGASTYTSAANGIIMLAFITPALIALHGRSTVFVLREDLRRRGWMVGLD
jgi:hypothetical protein